MMDELDVIQSLRDIAIDLENGGDGKCECDNIPDFEVRDCIRRIMHGSYLRGCAEVEDARKRARKAMDILEEAYKAIRAIDELPF